MLTQAFRDNNFADYQVSSHEISNSLGVTVFYFLL